MKKIEIIIHYKYMANGLGRGLGSLIPKKTQVNNTNNTESKVTASFSPNQGGEIEIDITKIDVNPMQPRKKFTDYKLEELVESIREHGIIQPLVVSKKGDNYELVAGERRFRASKEVGLKKVPVIIRKVSEQQKLELALIENIQRENLNPIDLGASYKKLMDEFNLTQEDMSKRLGKSRSSIANTIRMLTLPEEIQLALIDGKITEGHAKYLLSIDSEIKQMQLFRKIVLNKMSVKDTNDAVKRIGGTKNSININYKDKDKEFKLREFFGAKIIINRKKKGGEIVISFYSDDELNEIIKKVE